MKYFFFTIFFLFLLSLIIVYLNISLPYEKQPQQIIKREEIKEDVNSVLKALANSDTIEGFPAKELYLRVDLNYVPKTKILYQTILNRLDKYKLFGVEQILKLNNIKYSIIKSENDLKLFINFDKKGQAEKIMNIFKSYNLNVKLKKLKITDELKG
jgi:hypothetical protein